MDSNIQIPQTLISKEKDLRNLVETYPDYIPLPKCASFLGMDDDGLRRAIETNNCPFGIAWRRPNAANRAFKIPTFTFVAWYTKGIIWH